VAHLSQRGRATLHVVENHAVTQGHSKSLEQYTGWAKLNGVSFVVVKHIVENFDNFFGDEIAIHFNTHFEKKKLNTFHQTALQKLMVFVCCI